RASAPKEFASRVLMVERRGLQYQRSREPMPSASEFSEGANRIHTPSGKWLVIISLIVSGLSKVGTLEAGIELTRPYPATSKPGRCRRSASGRDANKHPDMERYLCG